MKRRVLDEMTWGMWAYVVSLLPLWIASLFIDKDYHLPFMVGVLIVVLVIAINVVMRVYYYKKIAVHHVQIKYFADKEFVEPTRKGDLIDLRSAIDIHLKKGEYELIPLGVAMKLPDGYKAQVCPRSSTYKNFSVLQANSLGQIDNGYCGDEDQWKFPALAMEDTTIHKGDRICQFEIVPVMEPVVFHEVESLNDKSRGGFGSTGVQ